MLCVSRQTSNTNRSVVPSGTCGTWSSCKNMHLTVVLIQRHFGGHPGTSSEAPPTACDGPPIELSWPALSLNSTNAAQITINHARLWTRSAIINVKTTNDSPIKLKLFDSFYCINHPLRVEPTPQQLSAVIRTARVQLGSASPEEGDFADFEQTIYTCAPKHVHRRRHFRYTILKILTSGRPAYAQNIIFKPARANRNRNL